jgi:deferrochelatase/peroxidase EfeB
MERVSRRRFLGSIGASGAGVALATSGLAACTTDAKVAATTATGSGGNAPIAFRGAHQAGITTPVQDRLVFSALDVTTDDPKDLAHLLETWTAMAEAMTNGDLVPGTQGDLLAPPADTGEAYGLPSSRLTITIGFGPSLFDDRFGLSAKKPKLLVGLPLLPNETIRPEISGGDICIQACADDPLVAYHAVRGLVRAGIGTTTHRWMQFGFGRTSSTSTSQATARNLMGFKDGTNNLKAESNHEVDQFVWVDRDDPQEWMRGGAYVVTRKIAMFIENWDHDSLGDQQNVIGRVKDTGAPLGEESEFAPLDLEAKGPDGLPVIPADAHVRLASPEANGGIKLLRRGYNYTDGVDPAQGNLQAGLFFIAYMNDPGHFIKVQKNLATDGLNEYIRHISTGIFACPGGLAKGETWKDKLFQ